MSEVITYLSNSACRYALAMQCDPQTIIDQWASLRRSMMKECPAPFSRDEWAYLITFLDPGELRRFFESTFGSFETATTEASDLLLRPRGPVAVWLPSNVTLLGPLMLVLVSLTGNPLLMKASTQAEDLAGAFLEYARNHLSDEYLARYLRDSVRHERFDREAPQNAEFSRQAVVRIVFGSNEAADAVASLPHRVDAPLFAFTDRRSEAWVQPACINDALVDSLIRVFAVYGQAGCTSPRRVLILDGTLDDARRLRDDMLRRWPQIIRRDPPMHVASACTMAGQLAAASGWEPGVASRQAAVIAAGQPELPEFEALMALMIAPASLEQACATMPANIQTIGHAIGNPHDPSWLRAIAATPVKRFVPIAQMHHMTAVWDGHAFWRQLFEEVGLR